MGVQVASSSSLSTASRYPTQDPAGNPHITGYAVLDSRYYDLSSSRFTNPDASFTGFGADAIYYTAGVPTPGHDPSPAPWSAGGVGGFPPRILVVATELDVTIFHADTMAVWMRFLSTASFGAPHQGPLLGESSRPVKRIAFDTDAGVLYVVMSDGTVRVADFRLDRMAVWAVAGGSIPSAITEEPTTGSTVGSIASRNVNDVLAIAGPGNASGLNSAWDLMGIPEDLVLSSKTMGSPLRQTLAIGCDTGLHVRASGLSSAAAADRDFLHVGPAAGGAIVYGSGAGDEILDDDGDPTGNQLSAVTNFIGLVVPWMLLQVNNGGWEPPVPISHVLDDLLTLSEETLVGHPSAWRVLPGVRRLLTLGDGELMMLAGSRLIHCGTTWSDAGASPTVLLNPSTTLPTIDLPPEAGPAQGLVVRGGAVYVGVDLGVYKVDLAATGELSNLRACYTATPAPVGDVLYPILPSPQPVAALAVDPSSDTLGLLLSSAPVLVSEVAPAAASLVYAFGGGLDFVLDAGLGEQTSTLSGNLPGAKVVERLQADIPGTIWRHIGAGQFRVVSLVGPITVGAGAANAVLGFAGGETAAVAPGVFVELDFGIQQIRRTLRLLSTQKQSYNVASGASIYVQQQLIPAPAPASIEISEPGGQSITDDGYGELEGDVDAAVATQLDYITGNLVVQFSAIPTGNVLVEYYSHGLGFSLTGFRNQQGPPVREVL